MYTYQCNMDGVVVIFFFSFALWNGEKFHFGISSRLIDGWTWLLFNSLFTWAILYLLGFAASRHTLSYTHFGSCFILSTPSFTVFCFVSLPFGTFFWSLLLKEEKHRVQCATPAVSMVTNFNLKFQTRIESVPIHISQNGNQQPIVRCASNDTKYNFRLYRHISRLVFFIFLFFVIAFRTNSNFPVFSGERIKIVDN